MKSTLIALALLLCCCSTPAADHLASKAVVKVSKVSYHATSKVAKASYRVGKFLL